MYFNQHIPNIRSVFWVLGSQNGGYQLIVTLTTANARADGLAFDRVPTLPDRCGG